MNFYDLLSKIKASKIQIDLDKPLPTFNIIERKETYIEPTFTKVEADYERPAIILISAIGATGKSALAQKLSFETKLPLFDLSKHNAVGDSTMSGLLFNSFENKLGQVIPSIKNGSFGIIIDGIDEGRSKTSEEGFYAFLDDVVKYSSSSINPSFVFLGRSNIMEDCWIYLSDKKIKTILITIDTFSIESARKYIDEYTEKHPDYLKQYEEVRDFILDKLKTAFSGGDISQSDFMSFVGYPPVLDAIVTVLEQEKNYYNLKNQIGSSDENDFEIKLLTDIVSYILQREKNEKVIPNIISPLLVNMSGSEQDDLIKKIFNIDEQCKRLMSYCLNKPVASKQCFQNASLNDRYEQQLLTFFPMHPFIKDKKFRNTIFESFVVGKLIISDDPDDVKMVLEYVSKNKFSYHLVYLLKTMVENGNIPIECLHVILASAFEFASQSSSVEINITAPDFDEDMESAQVDIEIEIYLGDTKESVKKFAFQSNITENSMINLGSRLNSTFVDLPCAVHLSGATELELIPPIDITAKTLTLNAKELLIKRSHQINQEKIPAVSFDAENIEATIDKITTSDMPLHFFVSDSSGITYPIINYTVKREQLPADRQMAEKFIRLRRILIAFRSHSRGSFARLQDKIEHSRMLKNDLGKAVLNQLKKDNILELKNKFYYLHQENVDKFLRISWHDLKRGYLSDMVQSYLKNITL